MSINDSEIYILNLIKNPIVMYPVFTAIENNDLKSIEDLMDKTCLSEALLKEAISFLNSIEFIEKKHESYVTNSNLFGNKTSELSFKTKMIRAFAKKSFLINGWGKQAAFYLVYKYLLIKKIGLVDMNNGTYLARQ